MAAKAEYLKILPQILSHSIINVCHLEESRQLLSYLLIHPAITGNERLQFNKFRGRLSNLEKQQIEPFNNTDAGKENQGFNNSQGLLPGDLLNSQDMNNAWQNNSSTRDSGIGLEQLSSIATAVSQIHSGGRAITSTAACQDNASSIGSGQLQPFQVAGNNMLFDVILYIIVIVNVCLVVCESM